MPDEPTTDEADAAETPPEPNPEHERVVVTLQAQLGPDAVLDQADVFGNLVVRVAAGSWVEAGRVARDELGCDYLSFIAGIDWQPALREGDEDSSDTSSPVQPDETTYGAAGSAGRFQVFAHVQSTSSHIAVTLKTDVDDVDPSVASWVPIYPGADWHERECWEMFGIRFDGHPALRHLYLPSGFEGHPLRKDFPLLARVVKPWPGLVDVEAMPGEPEPTDAPASSEASS